MISLVLDSALAAHRGSLSHNRLGNGLLDLGNHLRGDQLLGNLWEVLRLRHVLRLGGINRLWGSYHLNIHKTGLLGRGRRARLGWL